VGGAHPPALGCRLIGASDAHGAIHSEAGIDPHALQAFVQEGGRLPDYEGVDVIDPQELLGLECELLVPAALGGMIHRGNADRIRARMIVEGANSPTTPAADEILTDNGVYVIPDVMANAGGVVVSYFEWVQNLQHFRWDEREVNDKLGTIMRRAYREVVARQREEDTSLRVAAFELGIERVVQAARIRGYVQ
jgi:glutamate dehydrogenase (NAD(P)+)